MQELYGSVQQEVYGSLHTAHQWVNMTDVTVRINSTHSVSNLWVTRFTLVLTLVLVKILLAINSLSTVFCQTN